MAGRSFWLIVGILAASLGVAGAVLPLLPATPFLLIAAYAFARSSPALHAWLVEHPHLGPPINHWQAHGAISRRAKVSAMAVMLVTLAVSALAGMRASLLLVQAACMGGAATFILTRPDVPGGEV